MANLRGALELLQILEETMPPAEGQRHNITLKGRDSLVVSMMTDRGRIPITIDGDDLDRSIGSDEIGASGKALVRTLYELLQ